MQTEFEGGTAAIQATSVETTPLGIQKSVLDNVAQANDIATVVLLPQTPQLDMRIVSDVAFVRAASECLSERGWSAVVVSGSLSVGSPTACQCG